MGSDLAYDLIALRTAANDQAAAYAVVRAGQQMHQELLRVLDEAAPAPPPPPPGQGTLVDKSA